MKPKQIVEIPVQSLRKGLYVARLDRPWIDSPFLFQGFEISSDEELEQLQQLCQTVHVEINGPEIDELLTRSAPTTLVRRAPERPANSRPALARQAIGDEVARTLTGNPSARAGRVVASDPVPLRDELPAAGDVYGQARANIGQVLERLRRGGGLELQVVEGVVDSMIESIFRNRDALGWLARFKSKDDYLYNHSLATSVWGLALGRHLGLDRETLRAVGTGAMLLDVGKTQLPLPLLQKSAKPDAHEWVLLRSHVERGLEILDKDPAMTPAVRQMIRAHHERIDGSGYPDGLADEEIPLLGRIAGIVDTYDAMISARPYATSHSTFDAIREIKRLGGTWFQPQLVEMFIQAVGVFPTGALVELNTGEVAVVVAQSRFRRLRPQLMVVLDADKKPLADFASIDLQLHVRGNADNRPELWIERGLAPGSYGVDPTEFFL